MTETFYTHEDGDRRLLPVDSPLERAAIRTRDSHITRQSKYGYVHVPIGSLCWNTGAAIAAFADNTTDGFELTGGEAKAVRWNNDTAPRITVCGSFVVPEDADNAVATELHFKGARIGALDTTMVLTVALFAQSTGDAYDADADAGGNTQAYAGSTKIITDNYLSLAAGVLPAGATASFTAVADAALDGDDFILTDIYLKYTKAVA
jgi:hypothetical protein